MASTRLSHLHTEIIDFILLLDWLASVRRSGLWIVHGRRMVHLTCQDSFVERSAITKIHERMGFSVGGGVRE